MRRKSLFTWIGGLLLMSIVLAGCGGGGGGPTGPANPPQLLPETAEIYPNPNHPGGEVVIEIDYIDVSGTMSEGIVYISDSQNNNYQGTISNASGPSGKLLTSFFLSALLVAPDELLLNVWVQNGDGDSSNSIPLVLTIVQ